MNGRREEVDAGHAEDAARAIERSSRPGSVETLLPPVRGVGFFTATGEADARLDAWWHEEVATAGIKPSGLLPETAGTLSPAEPAAPVGSAPAHRPGHRETHAAPQPPGPSVAQVSGRKEIVEILRGDRFEERKFEARDKTEELK